MNMIERIVSEEKKKIPLEERLTTPEDREKFAKLQQRAREVEAMLFRAYPTPSLERAMTLTSSERVLRELLALANDARDFSRQYRGFHVGAVLIGLRNTKETKDNPWAVLFNANTKPPKYCAEAYVMDELDESRTDIYHALAFVVVAEPQVDDDSKVTQVTLTPCKSCRTRMLEMSKAENPTVFADTEIITADSRHMGFRKFQKVEDLQHFHKEYTDIE